MRRRNRFAPTSRPPFRTKQKGNGSEPSHVSLLDLDKMSQRAPTGARHVPDCVAGNLRCAALPGSSGMVLAPDHGAGIAGVGRDPRGGAISLAHRCDGLLGMKSDREQRLRRRMRVLLYLENALRRHGQGNSGVARSERRWLGPGRPLWKRNATWMPSGDIERLVERHGLGVTPIQIGQRRGGKRLGLGENEITNSWPV